MSTPQDCCTPCPTVTTTNVPGVAGATGADGQDGVNGVNAFSFLSSDMVIPPDLVTPVTITVSSTLWMVVGMNVKIGQGAGLVLTNPGPGTFEITAIPSPSTVTLLYLNESGDVGFGSTISAGAVVSAIGVSGVSLPLGIAQGGTSAITKAAAQTALGLGQDPVVSTNTGLTQIITNSQAQVGTVDVSIPAAGTWFLHGWITVDCNGVSFADRIVTLEIRDVTTVATIATKTYNTQTLVTTDLPSADYYIQVSYAAPGAVHIQMRWGCNTVNSAGTYQITAAELSAIPLRKS
jgi:hypothetical protein